MHTELNKRLKKLISDGGNLYNAMLYECHKEDFEKQILEIAGDEKKAKKFIRELPAFSAGYQSWYSESKALIKQLLPDRLDDFVRHYEKPKNRKAIEYGNYVIADYLQGLRVTFAGETKVGPSGAIKEMEQQLRILQSVEDVFESKLFDLENTLFADLLDSELDQARVLLKNGFIRASGAVAGVVLENHLQQICGQHGLKSKKTKPSIADFNDLLKTAEVIDTARWRQIQFLGDLRNLCDHKKKKEPEKSEIEEMVDGVEKVIKNVF